MVTVPTKIILFLLMMSWLAVPQIACSELDKKALFDKGVNEFKEGRFQEAVTLFTELISVAPDDAKALKNRGVALMNLGEIDLAIADFTNAIRINPELKGLHSNLGAAWHYKGEYEKAIACYDIDIAQRPDVYITYFNRAISKAEFNQLETALADIEKTLQLKPDFTSALDAKRDLLQKLPGASLNTYVVQAGAFLIEKNAVEMRSELEKKGYQARIERLLDLKQRNWYVVRLGKALDRDAAVKICRRLKEQGNIIAFIRPEGKL